MKTIHTTLLAFAALVANPACDDPADDLPDAEALVEEDDEAGPSAVKAASGHGQRVDATHPATAPRRAMPGAKAAFAKLEKLVAEHYVEGPISEDELWTGAMEGVLDRMIQLEKHPINVLLAPEQYKELVVGTKGKLVGVGIMIERVADVVVVREIVPGGPAERAGLRAGDRVLGIDGERVQTLDLAEIVSRIRGEDGTTVELFVQRDTDEWTETLTRGQIDVVSAQATMLDERVGYLRISSFGEKTAEEIDALLTDLQGKGMQALVLDMRDCPGGLFDASLAVGERFLPPGATIVTVQRRDGTEEVHAAKQTHPWQSVPMAVLIGKSTASGAEILADALHVAGRATLVGDTTMGKHTVESVHELDNGWAIKLSMSRFQSASGEARHGVGVSPQIRIPAVEGAKRLPIAEVPGSDDPALAAAHQLLSAD